jgi:hypothetical protein
MSGKAKMLAGLGLVAMACLGSSWAAAADAPKIFTVPLIKSAETPPCATAGASATGTATITIAADGKSISVNLTYSGLSGPAKAAHIHSGTAAGPGPVVVPFTGALNSPYSHTFTAGDYIAASGAPADFAAFVTALRAGGAAYINVHTAACGPGEIRAEIQ